MQLIHREKCVDPPISCISCNRPRLGGAACSGTGCSSNCTGGKVLCDRTNTPGFQNEEMCLVSGSGLIDTGLDVGLDMWDDSSYDFNGVAPEVGARESGTSRTYGGVISSCP
jgi:hypothetical protein